MVVTLAVAVGLLTSAAGPALAAPAPVPLVGPECAPNVVAAVLVSLARNGIILPPGTKVQYAQIRYDGVANPPRYVIEPCMVTIPG